MVQVLTEQDFEKHLKNRLGEKYDETLKLFKDYGPNLSFDMVNVLLHASDQNKLEEVLPMLKKHFDEHLTFQHPKIRGTVEDMGVNETQVLFLKICKDILQLQPTQT